MSRKAKQSKQVTDEQERIVSVRMPVSLIKTLEHWIAKQPGELGYSQSIRWITRQWLAEHGVNDHA